LRSADKVYVKKKATLDFKKVSAHQLGSALLSSSEKGSSKSGLFFARKKKKPYGKIFICLLLLVGVFAFWKDGQNKVSEMATNAVKKLRSLASESGSEPNP